MNQLLYGCHREFCDTPTCYTSRKRLPRNSGASRRLTLLSARIVACSLATQDDPLRSLCPGKPVVPTLASEKGSGTSADSAGSRCRATDELDDEEKENWPNGGCLDPDRRRASPPLPPQWRGPQKDVSVVKDKGLKDTRSFTQQLFNTVAMKMVEWIILPPPLPVRPSPPSPPPRAEAEDRQTLLSPQEPPKFKFPSNPMEVMDTGRLSRDSEPVTQIRHQEILQQQQPRKRGPPGLKEATPTPHSTAPKAKLTTPVNAFAMPPPPAAPPHPLANIHNGHSVIRKPIPLAQVTPSRGEKNAQALWEPAATATAVAAAAAAATAETIASPQSLKLLDEPICDALVHMCTDPNATAAERRDAAKFAHQSIFYVFSTPEALLASFGGIGSNPAVLGFDPDSITKALNTLYKHGWEKRTKLSMWTGLTRVFAKPRRGMSDRDAAGILVLALHTLACGLVRDEELFLTVTALRAAGRVSAPGTHVMPDIGFDDELAERLMKRVLRALSYRRNRPDDNTLSYVKQHLARCQQLRQQQRDELVAREFGPEMVGKVSGPALGGGSGIGLARCTLEWARAVFMRNWDGREAVKRESLAGMCVELFGLLHADRAAYGIPAVAFETNAVGERMDAYVWPVDWYHGASRLPPGEIHLLDYPYLLPIRHRVTFFRAINLDIMKKAYEAAIANIRMAGQMSELTRVGYPSLAAKIDTALAIYFVIAVRRANLVEDALNQLIHREYRELVRPLKIRFAEGEEGVDQGGVQQEFFSLLMAQILRPEYGLFVTDERTRLSWFSESSLEPARKFELVGLVVGLAVYNGITLPVSFPKTLYIKLLGGTPTLDDIGDNWPELASGLGAMLEWDQGDVGDVFVRTYEYSYSVFGQVRSVNMLDAKESGPAFLPQPVPRIEGRKKSRAPLRGTRPTPPVYQPIEWLPALPDPFHAEDEDSLFGLDQILETLSSDEETRQRFASREPSYTVSYHDLNVVVAGTGPPEDTLSSAAAAIASNDGSENEAPNRESLEDSETSSPPPPPPPPPPSQHDTDIFYSDESGSGSGSGSERSWQTEEDDPLQVKLPSDDGEDWDDRSTSYSPTGSTHETDFGPWGLATEGAAEAAAVQPDLATAAATPLPPTRPATPSPDKSQVEGSADDMDRNDAGGLPAQEVKVEVVGEAEGGEGGGEKEAPLVTNANRKEYVDDYISWLTDRSIRRQYQAFERGFFAVNSLRSLRLFDAAAFQALVEGESGGGGNIDMAELERICRYEDGYHANHPVIRDFWAVARAFSEDKKRLLLEFVTSSARIPIGGLENVMFHIVRNGVDSERLPSSLTCFGRLLLPEYANRKKLKQKLLLALENSKGFGNP